MHRYDPEQAPSAAAWLALDEQERIDLVQRHHRRAQIELPKAMLHATIHVVVENQIAEGHEPVVRAMSRLMASGLSRHDAVHAVGSVLAEQLFEVFRDDAPADGGDAMGKYDAAVERLTADGWLEKYS